jgi:murein DD-endopeptidase MepM/ murein hydrolase activator NlpD
MEPTTGASLILDGIRIQGKIGTAVKASAAGVVVDAGYEPQGRGRFVQISHEGGYKTSYEHLESVGVKIGEQVRQGDPIGSIGTTGTEFSEPTLFFKIEQGGIALDPAGFFQ